MNTIFIFRQSYGTPKAYTFIEFTELPDNAIESILRDENTVAMITEKTDNRLYHKVRNSRNFIPLFNSAGEFEDIEETDPPETALPVSKQLEEKQRNLAIKSQAVLNALTPVLPALFELAGEKMSSNLMHDIEIHHQLRTQVAELTAELQS